MADARGVLDGPAVRRWADAGLAALSAARVEIDALNVYPVADSDTGTNLVRTLQACVSAVAGAEPSSAAAALEQLADAALRGSWGNSGTIVSQLLRGLADGAEGAARLDGPGFARALTHAAGLARTALARPVEGTILSVADAAGRGAAGAADEGADVLGVVHESATAARQALSVTPAQLAALGGRVDAGGAGLVLILQALEQAVSGRGPATPATPPAAVAGAEAVAEPVAEPGAEASLAGSGRAPAASPAHEVMYLLELPVPPGASEGDGSPRESGPDAVAGLRSRLAELGDSVVVVGGGHLWQAHAHVDDIGAALEAGLEIGRPHRVRVMALPSEPQEPSAGAARLGVVAVVEGAGLADLLTRAGAVVVPAGATGLLATAVLAATHACATPVVALLVVDPADGSGPGGDSARAGQLELATTLAEQDGVELRILTLRSPVQLIAALAVHDPARDPARDLLEMATAAAGTRHGLVERAEGEGLTSAGWCHAGDVLGHVGGDVAVIGQGPADVAAQVVDLLLGGGGELVTLVTGALATGELAHAVSAGVRARRPDVEVMSYAGGQPASYLLVGVE